MSSASLTERLAAFREGRLRGEDLYGFIHDLGEADYREAEPDVTSLLQHPDAEIRYVAVSVLALHWKMAVHRGEFERMMLFDADANVRRMATTGLGYVLRGTQDTQATRVLVRKLRDETEEGLVREAAHMALLDLWLPEHERDRRVRLETVDVDEALAGKRTWSRHIDWDLVERIERRVAEK